MNRAISLQPESPQSTLVGCCLFATRRFRAQLLDYRCR